MFFNLGTGYASSSVMKALKIWGGLTTQNGNQLRTIVCATTKKRAIELLNEKAGRMTTSYFNGYWSQTGNPAEVQVAKEEGVWRCEKDKRNLPSNPSSYQKL